MSNKKIKRSLQTGKTLNMLRFATFLSPLLYDTYAAIVEYVGERLDSPTALHVGLSLAEFEAGQADAGFLCGLLYVHQRRRPDCPITLLAAPIVQGERYAGKPIYYSDVVVRLDSPYDSFASLQGCTWAYNELASHSGYNVVRYALLQRDKDFSFFGRLRETGSHLASLQAVLAGKADATAIDSHVLDVLLAQNQNIATQLRVVSMLGPTTIPPLVVSNHIDEQVKQRIQHALYTMHKDERFAKKLHAGLVERLVPIKDSAYDNMRVMWDSAR